METPSGLATTIDIMTVIGRLVKAPGPANYDLFLVFALYTHHHHSMWLDLSMSSQNLQLVYGIFPLSCLHLSWPEIML